MKKGHKGLSPTLGEHLGWGASNAPRMVSAPTESVEETNLTYTNSIRAATSNRDVQFATARLLNLCARVPHPLGTPGAALGTALSWAFSNNKITVAVIALHEYEKAFGAIPERAVETILACSASIGTYDMVAQMRQFETTEDFTTSVMHRVLWPVGFVPTRTPTCTSGGVRPVPPHERRRITRAVMRAREIGVCTRTAITSVYTRAACIGDTDMMQMLHTNYYEIVSGLVGNEARKLSIACAWSSAAVHLLAVSMNPSLCEESNISLYIICAVVNANEPVVRMLEVNYPAHKEIMPRLTALARRHSAMSLARYGAGHTHDTELSRLFDKMLAGNWPDYEVVSSVRRCSELPCFRGTQP